LVVGFWMLVAASGVEAQSAAVDQIMRLIADNMVQPGETVVATVVESDQYAVSASGQSVIVSTRFLREASPAALAAAVARDLIVDAVELSVVLDRAGLDGPGGLGELYGRPLMLVSAESQARAATNEAYRQWRAEVAANSFNAVARDGFQLIYAARRDAFQARYERMRRDYETLLADLPKAYAMRRVGPELLSTVTEVTAALRAGSSAIEGSPWAPRIRAILDEWEKARR
jgi:hypothetical protein